MQQERGRGKIFCFEKGRVSLPRVQTFDGTKNCSSLFRLGCVALGAGIKMTYNHKRHLIVSYQLAHTHTYAPQVLFFVLMKVRSTSMTYLENPSESRRSEPSTQLKMDDVTTFQR